MTRIPDAVAVASLETHCLIITVPNRGPADIATSLPRHAAADVLRQIADRIEAAPCSTALATGRPCPMHDAPTADTAPQRVANLDDLLAAVADQLPQDDPARAADGLADMTTPADRHPADDEQQRPHPNPFAMDPEQVERTRQQLGDAFATFGRKLRTALEQTAANLAAVAEAQQKPAEQAVEEQPADEDTRPVIEIDLEQPADEPALDEQPPADESIVVTCAHGYGLMRDSCPGCDAEQETPHEADPVTVRPAWGKRNMRRCRRCALVPSNPIHRAKRTA
ncbi:hypothetical protein AB0K87_24380 [Streptomyces sp. NPDC053705]|uniref:hypothetical protein n=1 Tax=Streptomyces sp. NPDC053705 TaxID=3156668 RepID=UPI00344A6744